MELPKQPSEEINFNGGGPAPDKPDSLATPEAVPAPGAPAVPGAAAANPASTAPSVGVPASSQPASADTSSTVNPAGSDAQSVASGSATSSASTDALSVASDKPRTAVIGGNEGRTSFQVTDKGWHPEHPTGGRKKWWIIGMVVVVVLGASASVFGWYLPSRPENVWKTGLNRTGKVVNRIVQDATDPQALATRTAYSLDGDLSVKSAFVNGSGKLSFKADEKNSDSGLAVDMKTTEGDKLNFGVDVMTLNPKNANYPDGYFRLHGLTSLPLDLNQMLPGITDYDNKWVHVPSTSLARIVSQGSSDDMSKDKQVTVEDVSEAARVVSSITREYVFTDNKDKAIIERKSFVGKETVDGVKAYHYTAAVNEQHAKDYCLAVIDGVARTKLYEKLVDKADRSANEASAKKDCNDSSKSTKASETFDIWIGGKYKLIHKVRITDSANKKTYFDIGQTYTGGDELPFFMTMHDDDSKVDARVDIKINSKTYNFTSSFSMKGGADDDKYDVSGNFNGTVTDKKVNATAPTGAVKLDDVLRALGLPPLEQLISTPTESI